MRIDITDSCRSRVLRSSWARPLTRRSGTASCIWIAACCSIAWVMTSSPTRLISWSTFSTLTRIDESAAAGCLAGRFGASSGFSATAGVDRGSSGAGATTGAGTAAGGWTGTKKP